MIERINKTRNGFLPPVVSVQAENGMRNNDPDKAGAEIKNPTNTGLRCITSLIMLAVVPNSETAAKPIKKPNVAAIPP